MKTYDEEYMKYIAAQKWFTISKTSVMVNGTARLLAIVDKAQQDANVKYVTDFLNNIN
jgi:hypothetical protein